MGGSNRLFPDGNDSPSARHGKRVPCVVPLRPALPILLSVSLLLTFAASLGHAEEEADPSELFRQAVQRFADFNTDVHTAVRKADIARYIPAGQEARVTLCYRVVKPAPAEEMEVRVLDEIYPFPVKFLDERGVEYRQEEATVVGTGEYVKEGAPKYPDSSDHEQLRYVAWNQWKQKSEAWAEKRRSSLPPDQYQVQDRGTAVNRPGMETFPERGQRYVPQVDAAWVERNAAVLGAAGKALRRRPDAALGAAYDALDQINSRVSGPAWAPKPGGILLSPAAAEALGQGLTIERVEYDPASGQVRIEGRGSPLGLDADILATTLRLACGYKEIPYFSLEPHVPWGEEWAAERARVSKELTQRLKEDAEFARRFKELSFEVRDDRGDLHRVGFLEQIDPEFARGLDERLSLRMDLVFRPRWLARTRLGEILFIADNSIKELWRGAAVWAFAPSRTSGIEGNRPPKFWAKKGIDLDGTEAAFGIKYTDESRKFLERAFGGRPTSSRWWFTPGGRAGEGDRALDLTQVQPILQTERLGDKATLTYEIRTPIAGVTIKQEIPNPFAPIFRSEDPWPNEVIEHVNRNFDAYARAIPEWEALREIFRAYVFAIWLQKHDPAAARRLLEELPPPKAPSRPLPKLWPQPHLLVARMRDSQRTIEVEQAMVTGGVGFERPLMNVAAYSGTGLANARPASFSFLAGQGLVPELSDDDAPATPERYRAWRARLLKERGFLLSWVFGMLDPGEVAAFAGIALALAVITLARARKAKHPFDKTVAAAAVLDVALTTMVFVAVAVYPSTYQRRTEPFTGWGVAIAVYTFIFLTANRAGRFGITGLVMTILTVWAVFDPGLGEVARAWTPAQLAVPSLEGSAGGPLAADTVYVLQALDEGLSLCRASDPSYAWHPVLWLLSLAGIAVEIVLDRRRQRTQAAPADESAQ